MKKKPPLYLLPVIFSMSPHLLFFFWSHGGKITTLHVGISIQDMNKREVLARDLLRLYCQETKQNFQAVLTRSRFLLISHRLELYYNSTPHWKWI